MSSQKAGKVSPSVSRSLIEHLQHDPREPFEELLKLVPAPNSVVEFWRFQTDAAGMTLMLLICSYFRHRAQSTVSYQ